jgi:GntR family transcriptional regulator
MITQEIPIRQQKLSQQIENILIERVHSGVYTADSQLPNESELAEEFKVSRATIRSALSTLATLGIVVRRHGAGTFVTRIPRISNPLDKAIDFQELIAKYCCQPTVEYGYCGVVSAESSTAALLQIPVGADVLISQKVFIADGEPMIYCINTLPAHLFNPDRLDQIVDNPEILEPFFIFLEQETGLRVEYYVAHVRPMKASNCRFYTPLPLPEDTPVLVIDEVAFTLEGRPIFHTFEYHPEGKMDFELIRWRSRWAGFPPISEQFKIEN